MDGRPVTEKFNRKTFDPINNAANEKTLAHLRAYGRSRRNGMPSTAYWYGANAHRYAGGHFLDIGCGDSWDYTLAKHNGYRVTRIDLFRPWLFVEEQTARKRGHLENFTQADAVEHIPLPDNSVEFASSQAMYDLVEPDARDQFHKEVYRVLKPNGVFSLHWQSLAAGWGFDVETEHLRVLRLWTPFSLRSTGFVVTKPSLEPEGHNASCPVNCRHCHHCQVLITHRNTWARGCGIDICEKCCRIHIGQENVSAYMSAARK